MTIQNIRYEERFGGKGHVLIKSLLNETERGAGCQLFSETTLEPGCSLGYHEHIGNSETYYILQGKGMFNDNGVMREVGAGEVLLTPDGSGHGLENIGDEDLVFIALILKTI